MKKILILGGTGAIGTYLVNELKNTDYDVYITSRSPHQNENNIHYIIGNAKNKFFLQDIFKQNFDCIVDFMAYKTFEFIDRYKDMLSSTKQYIFVSSYRVYADNGLNPLNENSPKLLDVATDETFLSSDDYSLEKARQEQILYDSKFKNYTIIRPSITFSQHRFQLGTIEADIIIHRTLKNKPIIFPTEMLDKYAAVSWAGNTGKMIKSLILNPETYTQAYNVSSAEKLTWRDIIGLYNKYIGLKIYEVDLNTYIKIMKGPYQVKYDRMFNRIMDNSKILKIMNCKADDLTSISEALKIELKDIASKTKKISANKRRSRKMDRVIFINRLRKLFKKD